MPAPPLTPGRYLLRGVLFVAIGAVLLFILQELSRRYPENTGQSRRVARIETAFRAADSIEVLVLGNSHASRAIDTRVLPGRAHVLGLAWNDIFEVEHQARVLAQRMPNLRQAVLVLSYTSFHWDNDASDNPGHLNSRHLFYAEAPVARWTPGDFRNYIMARTYWLVRSDHWYGVVAGIRGREVLRPREEEPRTDQELEDHADVRTDLFASTARAMTDADPELVDRAYAAAARTVASLQEQGVQVVLVIAPYHDAYNRRFDPTGIPAEMRALTAQLAEEHDVPVIDASRRFATRNTWFNDSDHLNAEGRTAFTRWLAALPSVAMGPRPVR
jgi:hypothetical protein